MTLRRVASGDNRDRPVRADPVGVHVEPAIPTGKSRCSCIPRRRIHWSAGN